MSEVARIRLVAMLEGTAFLLLLFVAMPLKYGYDQPLGVRIAGMTHGVLFMVLCMQLYASELPTRLRWRVVVAALLPFGPFVVDRELRATQ
jgi:integral membrane protein